MKRFKGIKLLLFAAFLFLLLESFAIYQMVQASHGDNSYAAFGGNGAYGNQACIDEQQKVCNFWAQLSDTTNYQGYQGAFWGTMEERGGIPNTARLDFCLGTSANVGTGDCAFTNYPGVGPWTYGPTGEYTSTLFPSNDSVTDYEYIAFRVEIDGINSNNHGEVRGRRVHIDSVSVSPDPVSAGGTITVSWNTTNAFEGVELFWDGAVAGGVGYQGGLAQDGSMNITAGSGGMANFTIKATGPGHNGVTYVEVDTSVAVGTNPTPPGPFNISGACINGAAGDVALSWSGSSNATSYTIERKIWSGGAWGAIASGIGGNSYTDSNAVYGADNYYRIFAVNGQGQMIGSPTEISFSVNAVNCGGSPPTPPPTPAPSSSPPVGACNVINNAQFIGWTTPPASMTPGQTANVSITMRNNGTAAWNFGETSLGSQNPQDNSTWGFGRVQLPQSFISPGQDAVFNFAVTAPQTSGNHNFQWRMVKDEYPGCWFGEYTPNFVVNVPAGAAVWVEPPICPAGTVGAGTPGAEGGTSATIRWDPAQVPPLTIPGYPQYYIDLTKNSGFSWFWNEPEWGVGVYQEDAAAGFDCAGLLVDGCDTANLPANEPATPVILAPGIDYYARIFGGGAAPSHFPNSSPGIHFYIPYCNPAPQQPRITAPPCSNSAYGITLDWSTSNPSSIQGYYVDVSNNLAFSPFYNRQIPPASPLSNTPQSLVVAAGAGSTFTGPVVGGISQGNPFGSFLPNTTYYFRIYNAQWSLTSNVLNVPSCTASVDVNASPTSGTNSLSSTITATVSGNASGNITYEWDCDYDQNGVYTYPNGTVTTASTTNAITCNYGPGTFRPNARVTQGGVTSNDATPPTVVVNAAPTVNTVTANISQSYCASGPNVIVSWNVVSGGPQTGYIVQIDNDAGFTSPVIDSGYVATGVSSYSPTTQVASAMTFNTTYYARVKVYSALGESAWTPISSCSGTGCIGGTSWRTPLHAYPQVNAFTWTPPVPARGVQIQFNDQTVFDAAATNRSWSWNFGDSTTSAVQNPTKTYSNFGNFVVTLTVRDDATNANSQSCVYSNAAFNVLKPIPEWKEILPR